MLLTAEPTLYLLRAQILSISVCVYTHAHMFPHACVYRGLKTTSVSSLRRCLSPIHSFVVLGMELRASQRLGKCSTNELQPQATLFFEKRFLIGWKLAN